MDQHHMHLILLKVEQSAFTRASFSRLCDIHKGLDGIQWPHFPWTSRQSVVIHHMTSWWVWPWIYLFCVTSRGENDTNRCYWAVLVKTCPLPITLWFPACPHPPHLWGDIGYSSKKLFNMAGNLTSYPIYAGHSELPWIAIDLWRNTCRQLW